MMTPRAEAIDRLVNSGLEDSSKTPNNSALDVYLMTYSYSSPSPPMVVASAVDTIVGFSDDAKHSFIALTSGSSWILASDYSNQPALFVESNFGL